jgi:hypothetical protein
MKNEEKYKGKIKSDWCSQRALRYAIKLVWIGSHLGLSYSVLDTVTTSKYCTASTYKAKAVPLHVTQALG